MIELLTVMLVISALSAMAVPRFREYKARALIATMHSDLGNLKIAEESYWAEHLSYSTDTSSLELRISANVAIAITSKDVSGGYTAVATHSNVPAQQCQVAMGREAAPREPGQIFCGPASSSSAPNTQTSTP